MFHLNTSPTTASSSLTVHVGAPSTRIPRILTSIAAAVVLLTPAISHALVVEIPPTSAFRFGIIIPHQDTSISVFNNGTTNIQHSIMRFDLSSLPPAAVINSAILRLYTDNPWTQPSGTQTNVFSLAHSWNTATANWTESAPGVPWTLPGGDVTGPIYGTNSDVVVGVVDGVPFNIDITPLVAGWRNATIVNNGLLLTGTVGDEIHFHPSVDANPLLRPMLLITYVPEPSSALLTLLGAGLFLRRRSGRRA